MGLLRKPVLKGGPERSLGDFRRGHLQSQSQQHRSFDPRCWNGWCSCWLHHPFKRLPNRHGGAYAIGFTRPAWR